MFRHLALALLLTVNLWSAPTPEQQKSLDKMYATILRADDHLDTRTEMRYVLEATALGESDAKIAQALQALRSQQELRPGNKNYGNFRWYRGQKEVQDRNAVQFFCQNALVLGLTYGSKLSPDNAQAFHAIMVDAAQGCRLQPVRTGYTNIFLMKSCNLVLLGQFLHDPQLTAEGRTHLKEWFTWTKQNGITEYNSTTYTGVDMDCALELVHLASDPNDQAAGRTILQLLWTEVAANWFEPAQRLGGSHSRDYNYLQGIGATDVHLSDNGWIPKLKPDPLAAEASSRNFLAPKDWTESLRQTYPREVIQRWSENSAEIATNWITPNYCVGTSGTSKAFDDKVFAIQFPGSRRDPMLYFVMESRNDPYGISKEPDSNGHSKTLHLRPSLGTVQYHDQVILVAADDTEKPKHLRPVPELKGLWSHLVFPAATEVYLDTLHKLDSGEIPLHQSVFLRYQNVTVGLRFDVAGHEWNPHQPLPIRLIRDGDQAKAARITIEHGIGAHPGKGLIGFFSQTAHTPNTEAFNQFVNNFSAQKFEIEVITPDIPKNSIVNYKTGPADHPLSLGIDLTNNKVLQTSGASPFGTKQIFTVNGQDPWTPLLNEALAR
jgi:hypothetical protein